jgi:hypothetical protein
VAGFFEKCPNFFKYADVLFDLFLRQEVFDREHEKENLDTAIEAQWAKRHGVRPSTGAAR